MFSLFAVVLYLITQTLVGAIFLIYDIITSKYSAPAKLIWLILTLNLPYFSIVWLIFGKAEYTFYDKPSL